MSNIRNEAEAKALLEMLDNGEIEGPDADKAWAALNDYANNNKPQQKQMSTGRWVANNLLEGAGQILDGLNPLGDAFGGADNFRYATGALADQAKAVQQGDIEDAKFRQELDQGKPVQSAMIRAVPAAAMTGAGALNAAKGVLPSVIMPGAAAGLTVGLAGGQEALTQAGYPGAAQLLGYAPMMTSGLARTGVSRWLRNVEANAPQRVKDARQGAEAVLGPNGITVTQSTASSRLRELGRGASGDISQEADARQIDAIANAGRSLVNSITPQRLSNAETANRMVDSVNSVFDNLNSRRARAFKAGEERVRQLQAVSPADVPLTNLTATYDKIQGEAGNIFKLAPTELSPRAVQLLEFLKGNLTQGTRLKYVKPLGAMQVGKAINELYEEIPQGALTPAMDATFKRLKAAYQKDIDTAISNNTINQSLIEMRRTNALYGQITDKMNELKGSVLNTVLGRDAVRDPDMALQRIAEQSPSAQAYTRRILKARDPEALRSLQAYTLEKHINDAVGTAPATQSQVDVNKLAFGKLADSGLFDQGEMARLYEMNKALSTVMIDLTEKAMGKTAIGPQEIGRMGASLSPIFLTGAGAKFFTGPWLERVLNTPEGRANLLAGAYGKGAKASAARAWLLETLNQSRQEDYQHMQVLGSQDAEQ